MEITVTYDRGLVPVTILHLNGKLDGSNYESLIAKAQMYYESGARDLVLDLSNLSFLSSAGLSALHRVALLYRGKSVAELEEGWASLHAIDRDRGGGVQEHVKLLNPAPRIREILEMVGFTTFFEIHADLNQVVNSFR